MKSKAIRGDGRAKEQMQVFIESDPDSRLPASDKENIPDIAIDYLDHRIQSMKHYRNFPKI